MAEDSLYTSSIDRIKSVAKQTANYGNASPARYEIVFSHPNTAGNLRMDPAGSDQFRRLSVNRGVQERLSDSCEIVSLPGRGHSSQANTIYGPVREMPYQPLYSGDLDLTFRVGDDYMERHYFEVWSDAMVDRVRNNYQYFDRYASELFVRALTKDDRLIYEATVKECYPKQIGAIEYGYEKADELTKFTISLAFTRYDITYYSEINPVTPPPSLPSNIGGPGGAPSYGGPNDPFGGDIGYA